MLLFINSVFILILSCSKDVCTPKPFKENIISTWSIDYSRSGKVSSGIADFYDNTFNTIPEELIIPGRYKTYLITGNNIVLKAYDRNGANISIADGYSFLNTCNQITIRLSGNDDYFILTR